MPAGVRDRATRSRCSPQTVYTNVLNPRNVNDVPRVLLDRALLQIQVNSG